MSISTRKRSSREEWQRLVTEQEASGLSQTACCERRSVNLASFGQWKHRLREESSNVDTPWLELPRPNTETSGWHIEPDLGSGLCPRLKHV